MSTMRAVVAREPGDPGVLELTELPVPGKTGSEFLIRIHAAGVNPIDVKTTSAAPSSSRPTTPTRSRLATPSTA